MVVFDTEIDDNVENDDDEDENDVGHEPNINLEYDNSMKLYP